MEEKDKFGAAVDLLSMFCLFCLHRLQGVGPQVDPVRFDLQIQHHQPRPLHEQEIARTGREVAIGGNLDPRIIAQVVEARRFRRVLEHTKLFGRDTVWLQD